MRIIKNNYNAHTEYERDCPRCNSKFAFSFGDLKMDSVTLSHYVECPCCGFSIPLKSKENEWIKKCIRDLDKDTDYSFVASGDTIVFAYKSDEDVPAATVVVAKKYQETDVKISQKNF